MNAAVEIVPRARDGRGIERFLRVAMDPRERRELLARQYLRRGFLESAADEWIAVCEEQADVRALVGLAQVAFARGLASDAETLAEGALELDPGSREAARLLAAARRLANDSAATAG